MKYLVLAVGLALVSPVIAQVQTETPAEAVKAYCEAGKYSKDTHLAKLDKETLESLDNAYMTRCVNHMSKQVKPAPETTKVITIYYDMGL